MKKTVMCATMAMALSAGAAQAVSIPVAVTTIGNNFTMITPVNGETGGAVDVTFTWDSTYRNAVVTDGTFNATLSSPTPFFGLPWVAHHVNIYGPGTYTFKSECAAGNASAGCTVTGPAAGSGGGSYALTVGAGQVAAHMLFDWGGSANIDVVVLWDMNKSWTQTGTTSPYFGTSTNVSTVWNGVSIDTSLDADAFSGTKMIDGPFVGFSANFNVNGITTSAPVYDVTAAGGVTIPASSFLSSSAAAATAATHGVVPPAGMVFNTGFVKYTLNNLVGGAGGTAVVTIVFPETIAGKEIYHFKESTGVYTKLSLGVGVNQYQLVDATTIRMTVDDGGALDDGPAGNNAIVDPIGVGTPVVASVAPTLGAAGGGGGCAIGGRSDFDPVLPGSLLLALSWLGWRRAKKH